MSSARTVCAVVGGLALFGLSAWLGFVLNVRHAPAAPTLRKTEHHGLRPPKPRAGRSKAAKADDDLDAAAADRHHLHAEPHSPELIQWGDWSAGGRFSKPAPASFASHQGAYPPLANLWDIVGRWNPDNVTIPVPFRETLAVLNFSDAAERDLAVEYRNAEVPFKIYDVPDVEAVRDLWSDGYLIEQFDDRHGAQFKVERSTNNHFMYWRSPSASGRKAYPDWEAPTDLVHSSFADWLHGARSADSNKPHHETEHRYLMMGTPPLSSLRRNGQVKRTHFVAKGLPCFTPQTENFFVTDIPHNKGIQCRFGMRGVIAEAHYDGGRNMVAMLRGAKRYILTPPTSCGRLALVADRKHPSFRHSITDWSHRDIEAEFSKPDARGIDTVVREGEILYIPSYWIHYIASLKYSIQCNTRSGSPPNGEGEEDIEKCMGGGNIQPNARGGGKPKKKKKLRGAAGFPMVPPGAAQKDH